MLKKRRPSGRENIIASAALEDLQARERRDAGMRALAARAPVTVWTAERARAIRLIDLERRARFARPLAEFA